MVDFDYVSLISTVGFPIVAFIMMYVFATRSVDRNTDALQKLEVAIAQLGVKRK